MNARILCISIGFLLCIAAPANAIEVSARVDRTALGPGDTLNLVVSIINGDGQVDTSAITDFKVIPRGSSTNMQFVNGRTTREKAENFLLIPQGIGRLNIPALAVQSDGATYHTEPIIITVSDQPADNGSNSSRDVFVEAAVSEASPYVGQQIVYTFRLHNAVQMADARFQPPVFAGFTAKEVKNRRSGKKVINGREFAVIEIAYVLVPLSAGKRTIEPAMLQAEVERPGRHNRQQSPFDRFFDDPRFNRGMTETRTFQTNAIQVAVQPLPTTESGGNFSGLVGRFTLDARLDKSDLKVGDSATLAITIQGEGNIMDASAPELKLPAALKTYDDNPEEKIDLDHNGYSGQKVFRTALVPVQAGDLALPPVQLTYFDVAQKKYSTLTAAIPPLSIQAGDSDAVAPVTIAPAPLGQLKKQVTFTGRDILPPKAGLDAIVPQTTMGTGLFLILLVVPAMLFGGLVLVQHMQSQDLSPATVMKAKSRKALKAASKKENGECLTHLYQALTAAIHAAAGQTGETLTWQEAKTVLEKNGWAEPDARQAAQLLTTIESSKFSGARLDNQQRTDLLKQVKQMIRKLAP